MDKQDKEIIEIKIRQIELSFDLIRDRLPSTLQKFLSLDVLVRDGIYKRIEFIIQNILDILAIFTKYFKKIPGDDESVIEIPLFEDVNLKYISTIICDLGIYEKPSTNTISEIYNKFICEVLRDI